MSRHISGTYWAGWWVDQGPFSSGNHHLIHDNLTPKLFRTRRECRAWLEMKYGYIREREDLKREPFCWRMPQAIKVVVVRDIATRVVVPGTLTP